MASSRLLSALVVGYSSRPRVKIVELEVELEEQCRGKGHRVGVLAQYPRGQRRRDRPKRRSAESRLGINGLGPAPACILTWVRGAGQGPGPSVPRPLPEADLGDW